MVWEHTHPRCSRSLLAWTGGKVVLGRAGPGCSRSALAGTGGKVGRGPAHAAYGRSALSVREGRWEADAHAPAVALLR